MPKSRGFTLIELLITISIIAILAAIGFAMYSIAMKQGRDSKRMSDLRAIQSALEQYYSDQGFYPYTTSTGHPAGCCAYGGLNEILIMNIGFTNRIGNPSNVSLASLPEKYYMNSLPRDPNNPQGLTSLISYTYEAIRPGLSSGCYNDTSSTMCTSYCLYAYLEIPPSPAISLPSGCTWPIVNGKTYNFSVTPP